MMRYSGVFLVSRGSGKRTHVAARPVTPEPMTATRIVPQCQTTAKVVWKVLIKVQWVFVKQHRDLYRYLESKLIRRPR